MSVISIFLGTYFTHFSLKVVEYGNGYPQWLITGQAICNWQAEVDMEQPLQEQLYCRKYDYSEAATPSVSFHLWQLLV